MTFSFLIMAFSGLLLFVAPPGRIARWSEWRLFYLTKDEQGYIHVTFMVLFIFFGILHIFFNWRPLFSYLKNNSRQFVFFTKEMFISLTITILFLIGSLLYLPGFSNFLNFRTAVQNSWGSSYANPPFPHAELSSLKSFAQKTGLDTEEALKTLQSHGIKANEQESLNVIAENNGITPSAVYALIRPDGKQKAAGQPNEYQGSGRLSIKEASEKYALDQNAVQAYFHTLGITDYQNKTLKELSLQSGQSPSEMINGIKALKLH